MRGKYISEIWSRHLTRFMIATTWLVFLVATYLAFSEGNFWWGLAGFSLAIVAFLALALGTERTQ